MICSDLEVFQWVRPQEHFDNIYMECVFQLLTRATWNQMDLVLALACHMQSALLPFQHFCTHPREPNPLDLCAGGNNLSSPLSSQSRLLSLVVTATIIRLNFGFGPGREIQETSFCSLTGAYWCHLVLPELQARCCCSPGLLYPERCLPVQCHWSLHPRNHRLSFPRKFIWILQALADELGASAGLVKQH